MVQNTAARILCRVGKYDHITPTLRHLHWLPVAFRIKYKVCIITFNAIHHCSPMYISDMLKIRASQHGLRSANAITLDVPFAKHKTLGDRAFACAAPKIWNSLPYDIRLITDLNMFKKKLKTHFFNLAYN